MWFIRDYKKEIIDEVYHEAKYQCHIVRFCRIYVTGAGRDFKSAALYI
jgi:hypothetical protein